MGRIKSKGSKYAHLSGVKRRRADKKGKKAGNRGGRDLLADTDPAFRALRKALLRPKVVKVAKVVSLRDIAILGGEPSL